MKYSTVHSPISSSADPRACPGHLRTPPSRYLLAALTVHLKCLTSRTFDLEKPTIHYRQLAVVESCRAGAGAATTLRFVTDLTPQHSALLCDFRPAASTLVTATLCLLRYQSPANVLRPKPTVLPTFAACVPSSPPTLFTEDCSFHTSVTPSPRPPRGRIVLQFSQEASSLANNIRHEEYRCESF